MGKSALILGGGGITGGVYELGVLSALDEFIVRGKKSADFDLFLGISAGSILASFLANGISVTEMCHGILGEKGHHLLMRREDIYEIRFSPLFRSFWRFARNLGHVFRYLRTERQEITFLNTVSMLEQFLPAGIFSNTNLERYVRRVLSEPGRSNDFRRIPRELFIVAIEIDTGERWIFGREAVDDIPVSQAIQASCAIPVFFEPVKIRDRFFVDGAAERTGHLDIPVGAGAKLVVMVNPTVPVYNDRTVVCIPTIRGHCSSITETGFPNIADQTFRINSRVKLELAMEVYRRRHPEIDFLLIEPAPMESTLFLYGSMNFSERVQVLNYGYNSAAFYFMEQFGMLKSCFEKHGMEVSLDRIRTDRFLELASRPKTRRRYALKRYR